jgi:uncharacterized membrane protein
MSPTIAALLVLAAGTFVLKALGPVLAGGRELSPTVHRATELVPAALLAALVATQTVGIGDGLQLDARLIGVAAAAVAVALRAPFALVVLVGSAVTALTRLVGWG